MKRTHQIFVSAENNSYCAWQSKLFYFSAVTRLDHRPIIIVHAQGAGWHPSFYDLVKAGATVRAAPSYARSTSDTYPPRNTAGTLLEASKLCAPNDYIVLCDPDMIFVSEPAFPTKLSGNFYSYLNYKGDEVLAAARALKIDLDKFSAEIEPLHCGVPYVIPATVAKPLAKMWLKAVDAFPPRSWIDIMHAFGLATLKLNLPVKLTDFVDDNDRSHAKSRKEIIHYCYGGQAWDKRDFISEDEAPKVWYPKMSARKNTVLGEILSQISKAGDFYKNSFFDMR